MKALRRKHLLIATGIATVAFNAGLRAARLEPRGGQKLWSAERIVAAMREFRREVGRWPQSSDWAVACEDWPSAATVYNRFGLWQAALDAAKD